MHGRLCCPSSSSKPIQGNGVHAHIRKQLIEMKKLNSLLILLFVFYINAMAQKMDTIKIENVLIELLNTFENKSFENFEKLLFAKEDYLDLAKQIRGSSNIKKSEIDKAFQKLNGQIKEGFLKILKKGEDRGIIWQDVNFEGYVFNSEELMIGNETKSEGFLVDSHIRLSYKDKIFTIIGIQLWLLDNEYKVKADELRGIFEIDLNTYVPADDMYLDEME